MLSRSGANFVQAKTSKQLCRNSMTPSLVVSIRHHRLIEQSNSGVYEASL